jgi:hypothetical protein
MISSACSVVEFEAIEAQGLTYNHNLLADFSMLCSDSDSLERRDGADCGPPLRLFQLCPCSSGVSTIVFTSVGYSSGSRLQSQARDSSDYGCL